MESKPNRKDVANGQGRYQCIGIGVEHRHADAIETSAKVHALISAIVPNLVAARSGDMDDRSGFDVDDVAAARHQVLAGDQGQSSRIAGRR